jgi:endonuclease YncB( thermonuclease family)
MRSLVILLTLLLAGSASADSKKKKKEPKEKHDAMGAVVLNGTRLAVRWTDGDSFNIQEGENKGTGTRLVGYNTLEAYGPVHSWGQWTERELYELAKKSSTVAASQEWECTTDFKHDGYKRLLIKCPQLAIEMARQGHGLAYAVDGEKPNPEVVAAQQEAMKARRGMWEKGTTTGVITSLHSVGEDGDPEQTDAYNRVVDTRTGEALKRKHNKTYGMCEKVCEPTPAVEGAEPRDDQQSCMVYVPFKKRYRGQPDCLK